MICVGLSVENEAFMLKKLSLIAVAAAVAVGAGYAKQSTVKVVIPITRTSAANGQQMFTAYCAPCHGVDGRGQGPVASALRQQPANLAVLSRKNGGRFPSNHVVAVLEFGDGYQVHDGGVMPVWGRLFGTMDQSPAQSNVVAMRISNVSRYVETLQAK